MIFQSKHASGHKAVAVPKKAGSVFAERFEFTFSATFTAATDKLELGMVPAFCRIVDYYVLPANLTGSATIGIMSGDFGSTDDARTVGSEFFSAQALASTLVRGSAAGALNLLPSESVNRGIGLTNSVDITGGATKTISLVVLFAPILI